jgi:hypothetical protein
MAAGPNLPQAWISRPAVLLAAVIGAGGLTLVAAELATATWSEVAARVWLRLSRDFFSPDRTLVDLHRAVSWIAMLALAVVVERSLRADRALAGPAARLALAAAAAMAVFSVRRVVQLALGSDDPLALVARAVGTFRFHPFMGDLNAAGSLQALFIVPAVWLAAGRRERWAWPVVALLAVSLWFSGSRAAIVAALAGAVVAWTMARRMPKRWWIGALVLAVGAVAFSLWSLRPGRATVAQAIDIRWHLGVASLRVAATDPLLGVGVSRLHGASASFISPELTSWYRPAAGGENAHNNFLQLLAESGVLGLAAFLWILVAATGPPARWRSEDAGEAIAPGLAGGFAAFLLTCLAGHPLLIDYVRACFFLAAGLLAARRPPPDPAAPGRRLSARVLTGALLLIALVLPGRVAHARQARRIAMLSDRSAPLADSVRRDRPDRPGHARRVGARAGRSGGAGAAGA